MSVKQDVERITGVVLRVFPAKKSGKYTIYDFVLRTTGGDLKVSRFGEGVQDLVGENVGFDATYNDQYDRYTVQGDVEVDEEAQAVAQPVAETATTTKAKRGRKQSAKVAPGTTVQHEEGSRESYRDAAVQAVALNLQSAQEVATQLGLKVTSVQDLIAVADMVGRTQTAILIDAQRRS